MESAFVLAEKPLLEILTQVRNGLPAPMFEQVASALGLSTRQRRTPVQRDFGEAAARRASPQSRPHTILRQTQRYRHGY